MAKVKAKTATKSDSYKSAKASLKDTGKRYSTADTSNDRARAERISKRVSKKK